MRKMDLFLSTFSNSGNASRSSAKKMFTFGWPFSAYADFVRFNKRLGEDEEFINQAVSITVPVLTCCHHCSNPSHWINFISSFLQFEDLLKIGGNSPRDVCRRILSRVMTRDLRKQFSKCGRNGNYALQGTLVWGLMIGTVNLSNSLITSADFLFYISFRSRQRIGIPFNGGQNRRSHRRFYSAFER